MLKIKKILLKISTCFILPFFLLNNGFSFENIYLVEKIKCQAESTSSASAKIMAIEKAQKEALVELFDRLKINKENIKFINSEILTRIVESISISDEVLAATKYSGIVDVYFNQEFVDYYLNQYDIKNGEVIQKKYLYIPILKDGDNYYNLVNNIWREKTLSNIEEIKFRGIDIPDNFNILNQNPVNHVLINKKSIEFTSYNDFLELLKEHNSNTIVFVIAEYFKDSDNIEIVLKEVLTDNVSEVKLNLFNKDNLSKSDFINFAASNSLQYFFKTILKNDKLVKKSNEKIFNGKITVYTLQNNINDIVFMKNLLSSLSFVKKIALNYQTTKESCFDIEIDAEQEELYSLFRQNGILMQFRDSKYYLVYIGL